MDDRTVRVALERHWEASDANDFMVEHEIYREDAVLDYPQSGERIRGRHNIQEAGLSSPTRSVSLRSGESSVAAISGHGVVPTYERHTLLHGQDHWSLPRGLVAHETKYIADRFAALDLRVRTLSNQ